MKNCRSRSGKQNSCSGEWQRIRTLEDCLAVIADINQARTLIKQEAWQRGIKTIFEASEEQKTAIERLKETLSQRWHELMGEIKEDEP